MPSADARVEPVAGVPLAPFCTLGVGGPARWFIRVASAEAVAFAYAWARSRALPALVLGGGSNLVVADHGVDALVLRMAVTGVDVSRTGPNVRLTVGAGESWDAFVADVVARGLAGVECLSGIPGTVGGTPVQNVGAYGQDVAQVIESVTAFDSRSSQIVCLDGSACGFGYRTSRFKDAEVERYVVCAVTFRLREGPPTVTYPDLVEELARNGVMAPSLSHTRDAVLAIRRRKGMVLDPADPDTRSVGSFFTNPVVSRETYDRVVATTPDARVPSFVMENGDVKIPAAWMVEQSGFRKGHVDGRVGLSSRHPLAVINRGGATAREVVAFGARIKRAVLDRFGLSLRAEPACVGFVDDPDVDFLAGQGP